MGQRSLRLGNLGLWEAKLELEKWVGESVDLKREHACYAFRRRG